MHSTQAVRITLAVSDTFDATPVAIVACPVSEGTLPAWLVVCERTDAPGTNFHLNRAIQREDGTVFFDNGHYDLTAHEAMLALSEKLAQEAMLIAGDEVSFDHGPQRPASDVYAARV